MATTLTAKYIASSSYLVPFKCFLCFVHFQAPPGLPPGQLAPNSFNSSGKNLALRRSPQAPVQASKAAPRPPSPFPGRVSRNLANTRQLLMLTTMG